jgi:hypothetical protein
MGRALALAALALALAAPATAASSGWIDLFDGKTLAGWRMAGPGSFTVENGALVSHGGMGLLWYERRRFRDFVLQLDWRITTPCDNSGVFFRFPGRPRSPWDAVNSGYEAQIYACDQRGPIAETASIYQFAAPSSVPAKPPGQWNRYEIRVVGQHYAVSLNGKRVTEYDGHRGIVGYVGVQNHDDGSRVSFRRIRIRPLSG